MSAWAPLRLPLFRAVWIANVVSNIGSTMNDTAAVWTMATLTQTPMLITLMQTMSSLPLFFLALPAGALADLVERRTLIMLAQCGALLTALGMAALAHFGTLTTPLLLLATFQLGVAAAFTQPAMQALIPDIVGREKLSAAIALGGVGFNTARSLGPVLGGLLLAQLGPAPVFLLNAISFAAVIFVMTNPGLAGAPRSSEQEQMLGAMTAAIRYARHADPMKSVLVRCGMHTFAAVAPLALLPIIVRGHGWSAMDFGMLMGCYGFGAISVAVIFLPSLRKNGSYDQVVVGAGLCSALAAVLLGFASERILIGLSMLLAGASWICGLNTFSLAAQGVFPNWVRARSSAIYLVVVQGAFGIGALVWGRLTGEYGATIALMIAAGWMLISCALSRVRPISHLHSLDLTPSGHWHSHDLATEPAPSDGPVLITIQYRVDPANASEFCSAMKDLRETRLRDGAFRCSMFVDLDDPTVFRETFLVGSWAEHLRQHNRATLEDRRVEERVISFHKGPLPPEVRHFLMINLRDPEPLPAVLREMQQP